MKTSLLKSAALLAVLLPGSCRNADTGVFALLNPSRTGGAGTEEELLAHFRTRGEMLAQLPAEDYTPTDHDRKVADEALEHRFFVHYAYQPSYFYGDDIDWTYWPVKDNELRWQLHRQKWFTPLGKMYRATGDSRYVEAWMDQYRDWIVKNPNGGPAWKQPGGVVSAGEISQDAPNWEFAWRPLEVSARLDAQIHQFRLFLDAPEFSPEFLSEFLVNYHEHMRFLAENIAAEGNHRLFEAKSILEGALFFPEFKESPRWKAFAEQILKEELDIQILPDGVQEELDPDYHMSMAVLYGSVSPLIPEAHLMERLHDMIEFSLGITYPDYGFPCFSDSRLIRKEEYLPRIQTWSRLFPDDPHLRWFATEGREGSPYEWKAKAWPDAGFYVFRTGWGPDDTVVAVKAGKAGAWHAQPDYGTFEVWSAGRNLSPDSGSYIYAGDEEVMRQRDWFRQTRVHNTLTLDGANVERVDCVRESFTDSTLVYRHESYPGLIHRRSFRFLGSSLGVTDEAFGPAEGTVAVHWQFAPGAVRLAGDTVAAPGLRLQASSSLPGAFRLEDGWYSRFYRTKESRKSAAYEVHKTARDTVRVHSVLTFTRP